MRMVRVRRQRCRRRSRHRGAATRSSTRGEKNKKDDTSAEGPIRDSVVWTDVEPNLDARPARMHGPKGAVYLGTVGRSRRRGTSTRCGGSTAPTRGTRPGCATRGAGAGDRGALRPGNPNDVYVGTTVGVWHGRAHRTANPPTWVWRALVNGLPEAAVEDLSLFDNGGLRLLRAAIAARGVWELRLGRRRRRPHLPACARRRPALPRPRRSSTQRDGSTARSWHGSPDVRPRSHSGRRGGTGARGAAATPAPGPTETCAASRRRSARRPATTASERPARGTSTSRTCCATTGRRRTRSSGQMTIDAAFWNSMHGRRPHATAEPWATVGQPDRPPTEADLLELTPKLDEGDVGSVSMVVKAVAAQGRRRRAPPRARCHGRIRRAGHAAALDAPAGRTDPTPRRLRRRGSRQHPVGRRRRRGAQLGRRHHVASLAGTGWSFVGTNAATRRKTLTGQDLDNTRSARGDVRPRPQPVPQQHGDAARRRHPRRGRQRGRHGHAARTWRCSDPHVAVRSLVIEKP